jgi:endonuclease/exonuclease/phosphatase family metal-dependent hydrolase
LVGQSLRVVSYNVRGLHGEPDALAEVVRALDPDVVVVQEAPRRLRWRGRVARLAHAFGLLYVTGGGPSLGNVIMTSLRVRPLDTWDLRYPLTPGRHMRGAAFARCSVGGVTFVVAGTHLSTDPGERPGQAELLKQALAAVDGPLVVAADVNDAPDGPAWRLLGDGLVDTAGTDTAPTFPAASPTDRLDAIFVDPATTVTGYRVVDPPTARRASDHLPVLAELMLP